MCVGPDYCPPELQVLDSWQKPESKNLHGRKEMSQNWWKNFQDPCLSRLIQDAYEANLDLQMAATRVLAARAELGIASGMLLPQIQQLEGLHVQSRLSENSPPISVLPDSVREGVNLNGDQYFTNFNVGWEIDLWGKYRRIIQAAEANVCLQMGLYDDMMVLVTSEVARNYINLRRAQREMEIADNNLKIQVRGLEIAQTLYENGYASDLDVKQAETLVHNTEAAIPNLTVELTQAGNALCLLLGKLPGDLRWLEDPRPLPVAPMDFALGIPADLLRRRPDIRAAENRALGQCARVGIAKSALYPSFSLLGSFGYSSVSFSNLLDGGSRVWTYGPSLKWDFLNYGRILNAIRAEDARFQESLLNVQQTVLKAQQEVQDHIVGYVQGQESIVLVGSGANSARRAAELASLQYTEGAVDYDRVLNTQQSLLHQERRLIRARATTLLEAVAIYKALGGGWESRACEPYLSPCVTEEMAQRTYWGGMLNQEEE